jgi:hypothetical protein
MWQDLCACGPTVHPRCSDRFQRSLPLDPGGDVAQFDKSCELVYYH